MARSGAPRRQARATVLPARARKRGRSPLPPRPTRLIGRERELALLQEFFLGDVRLATLTGPPGIGKTRLALEVAATLEPRLPDGVVFVDLAPIRDPALVMPAVLRSLGISEPPDRPALPRLTETLLGRELLLVLDNLEQVIAAGKEIGDLIASCPDVRILATSREPLHLSWEREVPVPPLEDDHGTDPAAVTLFIERARAIEPEFTPRGDDNQIIREICARLDGLPLAIEMAAARIKALPPREILTRLTQRFTLLSFRSAMVTMTLTLLGYTKVKTMTLGMREWNARGYPVVRP